MVIYDLPVAVSLHIDEAIPRRKRRGVTVLNERKRVVAGVDGRIAVHPNQLIPKGHFVSGEGLERFHEVVAKRLWGISPRGRYRSPEYALCIVEGKYRVGIVEDEDFSPLRRGGGNVLLVPGPRGPRDPKQNKGQDQTHADLVLQDKTHWALHSCSSVVRVSWPILVRETLVGQQARILGGIVWAVKSHF